MSSDSRRTASAAETLAPIRAALRLAIAVAGAGAATRPREVMEEGGFRVRFPRGGQGCEAVLINTGGGLVGGDAGAIDLVLEPGAALTVTTATAERVYRSLGPPTRLDLAIRLGAEAALDWLPQETILFSGAALRRRIAIDMAPAARLLLVESLVFGRAAMGEAMAAGRIDDRWQVRRGGEGVFAEALRLEGDIGALLARPAVAAGAGATATLLLVAPDAEAALAGVRDALADAPAEAGASAWNGLLVARFCAADSRRLRDALARVLIRLRGVPMPRVW